MLRLIVLIALPFLALCFPYYGTNFIPPPYPPPYYSDPMRPKLSVAKTREFLEGNSMEAFARRVKRQYYYGGYPYGYSNPVGTGSAWANGGGVVGNVISFLVG
uniref:Conserved secreted protein n=1 Tax=Haemonchus contortus TaxID=6289 RepID=A0A7I4YQV0_HAECO